MTTDTIADLLTRIRNAYKAEHPSILVAASRKKERLLEVLREEGYIESVEKTVDEKGHDFLRVNLRYTDGAAVIKELHRISSPGRRIYASKSEIPRFRNGLGTVIVSTSQGMMTDRGARQLGLGGELICSVF